MCFIYAVKLIKLVGCKFVDRLDKIILSADRVRIGDES
jgi:hypothetical protein